MTSRWLAACVSLISASSIAGEQPIRVVDQNGNPVVGAAVFIPQADDDASSGAFIAQRGQEFQPRYSLIRVGAEIAFPNQDKLRHHVYSFSPAKTFELELYHGDQATPVVFDRPGIVTLGCNVHDWMIAWVYVVTGRRLGITDRNGTVAVDSDAVPDSVAVWHPHAVSPTGLGDADPGSHIVLVMRDDVILPARPATKTRRQRRSVRRE
ncbi:MAG: methylamine utilization protein [Pseudomonadota bacterium]